MEYLFSVSSIHIWEGKSIRSYCFNRRRIYFSYGYYIFGRGCILTRPWADTKLELCECPEYRKALQEEIKECYAEGDYGVADMLQECLQQWEEKMKDKTVQEVVKDSLQDLLDTGISVNEDTLAFVEHLEDSEKDAVKEELKR